MTEENKVSTWRIILAFILDLFTAFFVLGYIIAAITGDTTESGFSLNGLPAVILFVLVVAYFIVLGRYAGGTIWQRILKAKRS